MGVTRVELPASPPYCGTARIRAPCFVKLIGDLISMSCGVPLEGPNPIGVIDLILIVLY
jgi:hypothetical protein